MHFSATGVRNVGSYIISWRRFVSWNRPNEIWRLQNVCISRYRLSVVFRETPNYGRLEDHLFSYVIIFSFSFVMSKSFYSIFFAFWFQKFNCNSLVKCFTFNAVCDPIQWILANAKIFSNVFRNNICKELNDHYKLHFYLMFNSDSIFSNSSVTNFFTLNRF